MFDVEYWHTALGIVGKLRRTVLQQIIYHIEVRDHRGNIVFMEAKFIYVLQLQ